MKSHWRKIASLLPISIEKRIYKIHFRSMHNKWAVKEKSFPPSHLLKQDLLKQYANADNLKVLVETGTYMGDMIFAMQEHFEKIFSIELAPHFYQRAVNRFKNIKNVKILEGDSGRVLNKLVPQIDEPALFWLDGHYSGGLTAKGEKDCPVYDELSHILSSPFKHTILIDDARLFVGANDYPTIDELKEFVLKRRPNARFELKNDAIIITYK
jgi:hypothetical protein